MDPKDKYNYIVRADFYPSGYIRPLGFTDFVTGETVYVDRIDQHGYNAYSQDFICWVSGSTWKGKYRLTYNYEEHEWKVERVGDSNE